MDAERSLRPAQNVKLLSRLKDQEQIDLFALAEFRQVRAADFVAAFVAGYEFACSVGALVEPAHYSNGFHATATIGGLGAAMA